MKRIRTVVISLVIALTVVFTGRKISEYSADPVGEKDCPPLSPDTAHADGNVLEVQAADIPLSWSQKGGAINDASLPGDFPVASSIRTSVAPCLMGT